MVFSYDIIKPFFIKTRFILKYFYISENLFRIPSILRNSNYAEISTMTCLLFIVL